jgi:hypothetical protein
MLWEILYRETNDKSPSEDTENPGKGEGGKKSTKMLGQKIRQTARWGGSVGLKILK